MIEFVVLFLTHFGMFLFGFCMGLNGRRFK